MADIAIDNDGELVLDGPRLTLVYDDEYIRQRLQIAFRHSQGEFFRDLNAGTDYLGSILGKSTDLSRRAEIRRRCLEVPGVREVSEINLSLDGRTRKLSGTVTVIKDNGAPLEVRFKGR